MPDDLPQAPEAKTRAAREIMALHTGAELKPVIPTTLEEAFRFAQLVVQAGLAPSSYETNGAPDPQKVVIGILTSLELGVPPLQGLTGIAIINNRATVWGDLAVALIQAKGLIRDHEVIESGTFPNDDYTVTCRYWRVGQTKPYEGKFSIAQAKKANLWMNASKKPWVSYPQRMLHARARAYALRDGFSDALKGLAIAEEIQDLPAEPKGPVSTDFLADAPQIANSEAGTGAAQAADTNTVSDTTKPETPLESPLSRGCRLLVQCSTISDVNDLSESILPELESVHDQAAWGAAVSERMDYLAGQK
jgi:hypothetical protein